MLRPCGIHPGAARPWLVSIFGSTLCWAAALGRQLAAALLAAQAVLAAGEGPYSVVPEDYNLEELPTPSAPNGDAVELEVGVDSFPYDVPKPDCIAGTIELPLRVRLYWYDPRLDFPRQVSNRTGVAGSSVTIDQGSIWKPDLEVAERIGEAFCTEGPVVLYDLAYAENHRPWGHDIKYNVMWPQSCTMTTRCDCDLSDFPFDEQTCSLTWAPIAERGYKVVDVGYTKPFPLKGSEFDILYYAESPPEVRFWDMIAPTNHTLGEQQAVRKCIHFERAPQFFVVNFLSPTLILVFMEWFTFLIPLEKVDRVAYGVTMLLANTATQFITADKRPPERGDTWIDLFSIASLLLIVYPLLITVILLRYSEFLSRKVQNIMDDEKKEEYEDHVTGFIAGVDRLGRVSYPIAVLAIYAYVFTTPRYGSRNKVIELFGPYVMRLVLFAFIIPASVILTWFSITSLISNGSGMPDRKYVRELMLNNEFEDHEGYQEYDSDENA